ncbi:Lamin-L(II) [Trichoplax sp. H2]|nr:Lamin-L(II) [Trichoplax sp. H2]|eukprot:RDD43727.1 Lamin-L(II) [Trichoplax sp. H2]
MSSPSMASPMSPLKIKRVQEKEELKNLTDRLASYIEKSRFLESRNARLNEEIRSSRRSGDENIKSLKALYEQELQEARKTIDEMANEKSKITITVMKYTKQVEELTSE